MINEFNDLDEGFDDLKEYSNENASAFINKMMHDLELEEMMREYEQRKHLIQEEKEKKNTHPKVLSKTLYNKI